MPVPPEKFTPSSIPFVMCGMGLALVLLMSPANLEAWGIVHLRDSGGSPLSKILPGVYFIFIAFAVFLCMGSPIQRMLILIRLFPASCFMFFINMTCLVFMILRSGPSGTSMMLNSHLPVPLCALLLQCAPPRFCRTVLMGFTIFVLVNSTMGLIEGVLKWRFFSYSADWPVLNEAEFRASAFAGHPLANAILTCTGIPVVLTQRFSITLRILFAMLLLSSLVAFGGRTGLALGVLNTTILAIYGIFRIRHSLNFLRLLLLFLGILVVPAFLASGLYFLLNSSLGARLASHSYELEDDSAQNRYYSFRVLSIMDDAELIFGVSQARAEQLIEQLGTHYPVFDLENPWLLLFVYLGGLMFTFWLIATILFILSLSRHLSFPYLLSLGSFLWAASLYDSFGRVDVGYLITIAVMVVSLKAKRADNERANEGNGKSVDA